MSQSATDQITAAKYPTRRRKPIQPSPVILTAPTLDDDARGLPNQINEILVTKAPEAIPLLQQFLSKLPSLSLEMIESEKRQRSIVLLGVPEAEKELPASRRQEHTEKYVPEILDFLDIEARPVEVFRMGRASDRPRLVKCVFPARKILLDTLARAHKLRASSRFNNVEIRKSMTPEERSKDQELRKKAYERNRDEHNGNRVYVVYRGEIVKASDIPSIKKEGSKNF
uniref:Uncharacterized protein n=1 Tax=Haemonchus contortus TaxID=6289 RepID=A0A7I4YXJ8_HAECO